MWFNISGQRGFGIRIRGRLKRAKAVRVRARGSLRLSARRQESYSKMLDSGFAMFTQEG